MRDDERPLVVLSLATAAVALGLAGLATIAFIDGYPVPGFLIGLLSLAASGLAAFIHDNRRQ